MSESSNPEFTRACEWAVKWYGGPYAAVEAAYLVCELSGKPHLEWTDALTYLYQHRAEIREAAGITNNPSRTQGVSE